MMRRPAVIVQTDAFPENHASVVICRLNSELVDAADGSYLWGEQYSCMTTEIFDVEAKISREISEKLLVRLTTEERNQLRKRYTANVEAYHRKQARAPTK